MPLLPASDHARAQIDAQWTAWGFSHVFESGWPQKNSAGDGTITENRRARRDFEVTETFEAGLVLQGTEVKSLRLGKANLAHSFATVRDGEGFLMNADIPEYVRAIAIIIRRRSRASYCCTGAN